MVKKILGLMLFVALLSSVASAQTALAGKVTDRDNGEPIIQCAILIFKNGIQVTTVVTDFDGNYSVQLDPGKYDVEARYVGYNPQKVTGINVLGGKVNSLNVRMSFGLELGVVDVVVGRFVGRVEDAAQGDDLGHVTCPPAGSTRPSRRRLR